MMNLFRCCSWMGLLCWLACSPPAEERPSDIISRDTMVDILTDVHLAEAQIQVMNFGQNDTARMEAYELYRRVFLKYQLADSVFQKSFAYYSQQPELFQEMYAEVLDQLNTVQTKNP